MKNLITYTVMVTYLFWGLNKVVNASETTLELWQTNLISQPDATASERNESRMSARVMPADPGAEILPGAAAGAEQAAGGGHI